MKPTFVHVPLRKPQSRRQTTKEAIAAPGDIDNGRLAFMICCDPLACALFTYDVATQRATANHNMTFGVRPDAVFNEALRRLLDCFA